MLHSEEHLDRMEVDFQNVLQLSDDEWGPTGYILNKKTPPVLNPATKRKYSDMTTSMLQFRVVLSCPLSRLQMRRFLQRLGKTILVRLRGMVLTMKRTNHPGLGIVSYIEVTTFGIILSISCVQVYLNIIPMSFGPNRSKRFKLR